jgi:hypothetical protein
MSESATSDLRLPYKLCVLYEILKQDEKEDAYL